MISFQYNKPSDEEIAFMQEFRDKYESLYNEINERVWNSRWKSLALTHLEESAMWLNKWITNNS